MASKLRIAAMALLIAQACVGPEIVIGDPRIGEEGRVKFTGGGCASSSSTTLAVGSTQPLTLEPQGDATLPGDLSVDSTAPTVIAARAGSTTDEVVLEAQRTGDAVVELRSGGAVWDQLAFRAEPAASVDYDAADAVFAGGTVFLKVTEVHGACGEDCPLLGEGFVRWSAEPAAGLVLQRDLGGVASFTASAAGNVHLLGQEPSAGALLVDHPLEVVPAADAGALQAWIIVMLPDETVLDAQPLPADVPAGSLFLVELRATAGARVVPLAGADVTWTVEGDVGAVEEYTTGDPPPPEGSLFSAVAAGAVTLVADVPLLGRTARFPLTVTAAL